MRRNLISRIFFIVFALFLSLMYAGCNTKDENIEVESIEIISKHTRMELNESLQLSLKILPENATNKHVTWYLNDYSVAGISQDGVLTAYDKDAIVKVYCISDNGIIAEKAIQIYHAGCPDLGSSEIWKIEYKDAINDPYLLEFSKKYNNVMICNNQMIDTIKEDNKDDLEFLNVINKLEESYFSNDSISNSAYIILKKPDVHNLDYYVYQLAYDRQYIEVVYKVCNKDNDKIQYFSDEDYIIYKIELSNEDKTNGGYDILAKPISFCRTKIIYDYVSIKDGGELE